MPYSVLLPIGRVTSRPKHSHVRFPCPGIDRKKETKMSTDCFGASKGSFSKHNTAISARGIPSSIPLSWIFVSVLSMAIPCQSQSPFLVQSFLVLLPTYISPCDQYISPLQVFKYLYIELTDQAPTIIATYRKQSRRSHVYY